MGLLNNKVRRLVFAVSFLAFGLTCVNCEAQLFRSLRAKRVEAQRPFAPSSHSAVVEDQQVADLSVSSRLPRWPYASNSSGYDPRVHADADAWSRYPKFIGGFHSSHFSNVGLPSGDIGFRGNGLYWTPW